MKGMVAHLIFYVSDRGSFPFVNHYRKMDAGCEITEHISDGMRNCQIMKYTEYDGSVIDAKTVGIVFPAHMWGSSFAVCEFLRRLRVDRETYVYAVAVGETLSRCADDQGMRAMNSLRDISRIFILRGFGTELDIYVRFVDRDRVGLSTEERMKRRFPASENLQIILNGMRYHSMEFVRKEQALYKEELRKKEQYKNEFYKNETKQSYYYDTEKRLVLHNVFLDERIMQGVRLCRGI